VNDTVVNVNKQHTDIVTVRWCVRHVLISLYSASSDATFIDVRNCSFGRKDDNIRYDKNRSFDADRVPPALTAGMRTAVADWLGWW